MDGVSPDKITSRLSRRPKHILPVYQPSNNSANVERSVMLLTLQVNFT
jgi:hypothetical protein